MLNKKDFTSVRLSIDLHNEGHKAGSDYYWVEKEYAEGEFMLVESKNMTALVEHADHELEVYRAYTFQQIYDSIKDSEMWDENEMRISVGGRINDSRSLYFVELCNSDSFDAFQGETLADAAAQALLWLLGCADYGE